MTPSSRRNYSYKRSRRRRSGARRSYLYASSTSQADVQLVGWKPSYNLKWAKVPSLALLCILLSLLAFFFLDDRFFVTAVQVSGSELIAPEEICEVAGLRNWSIFYVNTKKVTEEIRAHFPCARSVSVRCRLPAQVLVNIKEREAEAIWETKTGRYLVDAEGIVLEPVETLAENVILIKDHDGQPVELGGQVDSAAVKTAQEIHECLPDARLFYYTRDKGIVLPGPHGWPVFFGTGGDTKAKVANLEAIAQEIERQGVSNVEYIDLRFEGNPLYREARNP